MSVLPWMGVATLAGITSHLTIFIHGEWDGRSPSIPKFYAAAEITLLAYILRLKGLDLWNNLVLLLVVDTGYLLGLFGSIGLYRAFFHPLHKFPGPLKARLSCLWSSYMASRDFKFPLTTDALHRKYGDFIRIRPREISFNSPNAVLDIHGPGSVCTKGPFYDFYHPNRSLHMTRDKVYHSRRRKVWDRGFTVAALSQYQPRVRQHCQDLISQISMRVEVPINASLWMRYFGFDVMGDLSFGKSFQMLKTGKNAFVLDTYIRSLPIVGIAQFCPWLFILFQRLPFITQKRLQFSAWCRQQVQERKEMGESRTDLFTYLLGDGVEESVNVPLSDSDIIRDAQLAVVAGSDTTSTTLAAVLYLLAKYPEQQKRLQVEIDSLTQLDSGEPPYETLVSNAPFLNGCINEALRLYPPASGGAQRLTPRTGARIAGKWIPGDTIVSTPTYTLHRDPRNFSSPNSFIPDRWSSLPELIHRKQAFIPFLAGAYSCAGKRLAYMEIRMALAAIVWSFSFRFPSDAGSEIYGLFDSSAGFKDFYTAHTPDFNLVFSHRSRSAQ